MKMKNMSEVLTQEKLIFVAQRLNALAQSGLTYLKDVFDKERYEALREIAAGLLSSQFDISRNDLFHVSETGYATPKTDVRAFILRNNRILMVKEAADGLWSLPGGWADVGDTPSEAVRREVEEETGLKVRVTKLLGVWDRNLHGHPPLPWHVYKLIFLCEEVGGSLSISHESLDADFFDVNDLPELSLSRIVPEQIAVSLRVAKGDEKTWFD
ncbi:NUDIX hydrolase [Escherichia coli]|uniref:NUDIX hydrolase n=1 Tax=Escherichia coli TaxID=562 RepID=UPI001260570C|nr:NUDIX hydrolase [Escherichia coli]